MNFDDTLVGHGTCKSKSGHTVKYNIYAIGKRCPHRDTSVGSRTCSDMCSHNLNTYIPYDDGRMVSCLFGMYRNKEVL